MIFRKLSISLFSTFIYLYSFHEYQKITSLTLWLLETQYIKINSEDYCINEPDVCISYSLLNLHWLHWLYPSTNHLFLYVDVHFWYTCSHTGIHIVMRVNKKFNDCLITIHLCWFFLLKLSLLDAKFKENVHPACDRNILSWPHQFWVSDSCFYFNRKIRFVLKKKRYKQIRVYGNIAAHLSISYWNTKRTGPCTKCVFWETKQGHPAG